MIQLVAIQNFGTPSLSDRENASHLKQLPEHLESAHGKITVTCLEKRSDTGKILRLILTASLLLPQGIMQGNMREYMYKGSIYPIELINLLLHPSG